MSDRHPLAYPPLPGLAEELLIEVEVPSDVFLERFTLRLLLLVKNSCLEHATSPFQELREQDKPWEAPHTDMTADSTRRERGWQAP